MAPPNQTGPWDTVAGSTSSEWETLIGCTDGSNPTIMAGDRGLKKSQRWLI